MQDEELMHRVRLMADTALERRCKSVLANHDPITRVVSIALYCSSFTFSYDEFFPLGGEVAKEFFSRYFELMENPPKESSSPRED